MKLGAMRRVDFEVGTLGVVVRTWARWSDSENGGLQRWHLIGSVVIRGSMAGVLAGPLVKRLLAREEAWEWHVRQAGSM